jgi:hypothetical protein
VHARARHTRLHAATAHPHHQPPLTSTTPSLHFIPMAVLVRENRTQQAAVGERLLRRRRQQHEVVRGPSTRAHTHTHTHAHLLLSTAFCAYSVWKSLPSGEYVSVDRSYCGVGCVCRQQQQPAGVDMVAATVIRSCRHWAATARSRQGKGPCSGHRLTPVPIPDMLAVC